MKKLTLSLLLCLSLLLSSTGTATAASLAGVIPEQGSAVSADSGKNPFVAVAQVFVVSPGVITDTPLGKNRIQRHTVGETAWGPITSSPNWPAVMGKEIMLIHESDVVYNLASGTFTGKAKGQVLLGTNLLFSGMANIEMAGTYEANLHGKGTIAVTGQPAIFEYVFDVARWQLQGAVVSAEGVALATLSPTVVPFPPYSPTLGGEMVLRGKYW